MCLAVPGQILSIEQPDPLFRHGRVQFGGIVKQVNLTLVPDAREGDYVMVHVGMAISQVDEAEAKRTLEVLEQMGDLAELDPERGE